jgi:F-type H+-transporting ATPase subunit epsilon
LFVVKKNRYNKYTQIAARAVRQSLKENERVTAEKRGLTSLRYQHWEGGKGGEQVAFFFPLVTSKRIWLTHGAVTMGRCISTHLLRRRRVFFAAKLATVVQIEWKHCRVREYRADNDKTRFAYLLSAPPDQRIERRLENCTSHRCGCIDCVGGGLVDAVLENSADGRSLCFIMGLRGSAKGGDC